jgi:2-dehydro-3-deoxyphosphogluconate aldolase/(4S)-4-hydroxy-2-oxoglutarate aldolase
LTHVSDVLHRSPVIPVVTVADPGRAVPLAEALLAGGIGVVEITLRTPAGLAAVRAVAREVPAMLVGAGTVLDARQADAATDAGAAFLVTPGATPDLLGHLARTGAAALPGAATVGEVMAAREHGFLAQKAFPASALGPAFLAAVAGPLPDVVFCPTGGVTAAGAADYLALPNVACVGGSWLTPPDAVRDGDWPRITRLATEASTLRPPAPTTGA